jgi:hypothetical protein
MMHNQIYRAHGGQGGLAESMPPATIHAVVRPAWGAIRVWQGHGASEDFTFAEARKLCVAADTALTGPFSDGRAFLFLGEECDPASDLRIKHGLRVKRGWLVAFLAAMRKALRTLDAATDMAGAAR